MSAPPRRRVPGLLLLATFAISQLGFCLAVPAFRGIDEFDHAFRASSVANGHWWAGDREPQDGRGYLIPVDASIATAAFEACDALSYTGPDNCTAVTEPDDAGDVDIASAAASYNPVWYAVTGLTSRAFSGDQALYAMRITGMILVDLLLLGALTIGRSARNPMWMMGGIAIACTPILLYSSTVAAPNGATYAAGVLLWVSLLSLAEQPVPRPGTWLGIGVGAAAIMVTHSTGVLFVPLVLLCAAPLLWRRRSVLWDEHRRPLLCAAGSILIVGLGCVAWILTAGTNDPRTTDASLGTMPIKTAVIGPVLWFLQSIATLAFRNEPAPIAAYVLGATAVASAILLGFRRAEPQRRLSMLLILGFSIVVPITLTWLAYSSQGAAWQGRYSLPLTVGLVLLGAQALGNAEAAGLAPVIVVLLFALVAAHAITIGAVARSFDDALSTLQVAALVGGGLIAALLAARAIFLLRPEVVPHS